MAATDYALLIAALRVEADDTATSNPQFQQTPPGTQDGVNTLFRLPDTNIVVGSAYLTLGTITRAQTGFTLDAPSGYVTMGTAPGNASLATTPFFFDYCFQWYTDADYAVMIDRATEDCGGVAGTALDPGLNAAIVQFALARYWTRRSSSHANKYATSAGGAGAQAQTPAQNFRALAKDALAAARVKRDEYQKGSGQQLQPFSGTVTMGMDPITPRY